MFNLLTFFQEADRAANLSSLAHQFDLQARRAIYEVMKDLTSTPIDTKTARTLGKDLSTLKQLHIASIHKHANSHTINELVQAFKRDLEEHVLRVIIK